MNRMSPVVARVAAAALALAAVTRPVAAQAPADQEGVRRAALDYLEGFYEGDSAKLIRSIRPEVYKFGFGRHRDSASYNAGQQMTWPGFLSYAANVKASNRPPPPNAPKEVMLLDVQNQTASVKVTAWWGTDYLLLGKFGERWMITHVLWQSPPAKRE